MEGAYPKGPEMVRILKAGFGKWNKKPDAAFSQSDPYSEAPASGAHLPAHPFRETGAPRE